MVVKDFVIPITKDDLLRNNAEQYSVSEVTSIRGINQALDATKNELQNKRTLFILDSFDTFFSVLVHGNKLEIHAFLRSFDRITKAVQMLIEDLEEDLQSNEAFNMRAEYLCANKMLAYLWSSIICHVDNHFQKEINDVVNIGKRKKVVKKSDAAEEWEQQRQGSLELLYRWLQLPLHKLWNPPVIEDAFLNALSEVCYKLLELAKEPKQKRTRDTIFEILATLVKKHNQGITCVIRIVQLVTLYDYLAAPLAVGVVQMAQNFRCTGMMKEIMRELSQNEPQETEARNISLFLETIASTAPDLILPILDNITCYLDHEFYSLRNCVMEVLSVLIISALTSEDLSDEKKDKRDECLDYLEDHILDNNAYVRSKVLQVWQRLCTESAIPVNRQTQLLVAVVKRLEDKSANVRKQALQLIRALLEGNPFAAKLDKENFSKQLVEAKAKLKEAQTAFVSRSERGDEERMELLKSKLPHILETIKDVLNNEENSEEADDDVNINEVFEEIRQLMLEENLLDTVKRLKTVIKLLPNCEDFDTMKTEDKTHCLLLVLGKIFAESEDSPNQIDTNKNVSQAVTKSNDRNLMKQKEELKKKKQIVSYFENSLTFSEEMEKAIPFIEYLLFSTTVSDAVESCALLGSAYQFEIKGADRGIRKALYQVLMREQSVRDNVAIVYQKIYLCENEASQSVRQKALKSVNKLIDLVKSLEPGQSPALAQMINTWHTKNDFNADILQVLWEKFTLKLPDTSAGESRMALMLITMAAEAEPGIILGNLDTLIKVGFGPRSETDLLLARDTCRAFMQIKQDTSDIKKPPTRYVNDHDIFKHILQLLENSFSSKNENGYMSFATDAINVIYHLANQPDQLAKTLLIKTTNLFNETNQDDKKLRGLLLSRLVYLIGHVAIRQMVYLDTTVFKELKRRNALRDDKKGTKGRKTGRSIHHALNVTESTPNSASVTRRNKELSTIEDNGEDALEGATADDADADFINAALENEIFSPNGFLGHYVQYIVNVCQDPDRYNDEKLQAYSVLALCKMMTISSTFCANHLQLLVTILGRSQYPGIRSNILIGLTDLAKRFPNEVEPWTGYIYDRLQDKSDLVRSTCVRMLSNLIMREMIRVKGRVSELALCIVDPNPDIRHNTKLFFKELSQKGNALYNVMPDILSRLSDPDLKLDEGSFQEILQFILGLLQKERQIDTLIEKICARFKLATTERQWRDLSYCLSLLQFNAKSIRRLIEGLPLLKDKIHNKQVLKALNSIINTTKKKPEAKAVCLELEEKMNALLNAENNEKDGDISDSEAMPPPPVPPMNKKKPRQNARVVDDDSSDSDDEAPPRVVPVKKRPGRKPSRKSESESEPDSEESFAESTPIKSKATPRRAGTRSASKPTKESRLQLIKAERTRNTPSKAAKTPVTATRSSSRTEKRDSERHADSQRISDSDTPLSRPPQVKRTKQEEVVRRSSSRVSNRPKRHS